MADQRMPASHYAGRVIILATIGVLALVLGATGVVVGAARWAADCGGRITSTIWAPLLQSSESTAGSAPVPWRIACGIAGDDIPAG